MEGYINKIVLSLDRIEILGNSVLQYSKILIVFVVGVLLFYILKKIINTKGDKLVRRTRTKIDDIVLSLIKKVLIYIVFIPCIYISRSYLNLTADIESLFNLTLFIILVILISYYLNQTLQKSIDTIIKPIIKRSETKLDDQLLPVFKTTTKITIFILATLIIITNLGYDFTSLIAGLGIGGLAVALAAQQTLGNFFASIAIFSDQPFQINDLIKIDNILGNVIQVGFRSTRIKTLEGTEIVIPNSKLADSVIENITKRSSVRINTELGVKYDTSPQKLERAINIIKEIIKNERNVEDDSYVIFSSFNDSSLSISVSYWINLQNRWDDILQTKHRINMRVKEQFEEEHISFAYPTQEIFLHK